MLSRLRCGLRLTRSIADIIHKETGTGSKPVNNAGFLEPLQSCNMALLPFEDATRPAARRRPNNAQGIANENASEGDEDAGDLKLRMETAKTITESFMFPWEKRQLGGEGTPLKTWEKYYWWFFAGGMAILLFTTGRNWNKEEEEEEVDEELEAKKQEVARAALAGFKSFVEDEDPFEGLSPKEIEEYVQKTTGASHDDPFEGMSPEEINEYVEKHGEPGA